MKSFIAPLLARIIFFGAVVAAGSQIQASAQVASAYNAPPAKPVYRIDASIDYELLTFHAGEQVTVPVAPGDTLQDVVLFVYANAGSIGGNSGHKNIVVDQVLENGVPLAFSLQGPLLRVRLPRFEQRSFDLQISYRGVIPRSPAGSGGLMDMMGDISGDLGGMLGGLMGGGDTAAAQPKVKDYGLYTEGDGIVSLGSYWYPQLAVRENGRWADQVPDGVGDVEYSTMCDFWVTLHVPQNVMIAAAGQEVEERPAAGGAQKQVSFLARNVRDFAVLMSPNFVQQALTLNVGGRPVVLRAYTTAADAGRIPTALDIASHSLQDYTRRFGPYLYPEFKVVEGPIRGGAGGMEFSGLTSIASALYGDLGKQLNELAGELGAGDLNQIMAGLDDDAPAGNPGAPGAHKPPAQDDTDNPAASLLQGLLGSQKETFDSLFEVTIAHEVAHQWWAIGVGNNSQGAPFVDEALAQYSAMIYFEDRYGAAKAEKMMDVHCRTAYSMGRMLGGGDAPANLRTSAYKNDMQYGAVVYGKGALYYDALRKLVGDGPFFASLRDYYYRYGGQLAGLRTLLEVVKAHVPARAGAVEALYRHWIMETHGDQDISGGPAESLTDLLGLGGGALNGLLGGD